MSTYLLDYCILDCKILILFCIRSQICHRPQKPLNQGLFFIFVMSGIQTTGCILSVTPCPGRGIAIWSVRHSSGRHAQTPRRWGTAHKGDIGSPLFGSRPFPKSHAITPHRIPQNTSSHQHYFSSTSPLFLHFNSVEITLNKCWYNGNVM